MFHQVLVAVDRNDSSSSQQVIQQAIDLGRTTGAQLRFLHVLQPIEAGYPEFPYPAMDITHAPISTEAFEAHLQKWRGQQQAGLEFLRSQAEAALQSGITADYVQHQGEPSRLICQVAKQWPADLIIVGRRGHSGLGEWLMGSVSNYVLHHAPCSVLTIQGSN